jgi:NAD(P)-dependent dehydrogenase (short-subunit alcohol dehydrogenase family)
MAGSQNDALGKAMSSIEMKHKVVAITGAASGIGLALARKFAREGAQVALIDMDPAALEKREQELKAAGCRTMAVTCDVTDPSMCTSAINAVIAAFGGIDILVNNAGITQRSRFVDTRVDVFHKVMAVNFFGSLYCTKAAIDSLIERRGLIIVNESVAGLTPLLGRTGYSASKHALHGLFTSLRCELRSRGVHVLIVCPGFIKTNLQTRALGADGRVTDRPQSRVGSQATPESAAEEIYRAAVKKKHLLILTFMGKLGYWVSRVAPVLYEKMMTKKFEDEMR